MNYQRFLNCNSSNTSRRSSLDFKTQRGVENTRRGPTSIPGSSPGAPSWLEKSPWLRVVTWNPRKQGGLGEYLRFENGGSTLTFLTSNVFKALCKQEQSNESARTPFQNEWSVLRARCMPLFKFKFSICSQYSRLSRERHESYGENCVALL